MLTLARKELSSVVSKSITHYMRINEVSYSPLFLKKKRLARK